MICNTHISCCYVVILQLLCFNLVDTCYLSTEEHACTSTFGWEDQKLDRVKGHGYMDAVVVCGSEGEVKNDPLSNNVFQYFGSTPLKMDLERR